MTGLIKNDEVPIGFSMALARDLDAFNAFTGLNDDTKKEVINHSRELKSKEEMQQYVSSLSNNSNRFF